MSIIRKVSSNRSQVVLENSFFDDPKLSLAAKGYWACLSRENDGLDVFEVNPKNDEEKVLLQELIDAGYFSLGESNE